MGGRKKTKIASKLERQMRVKRGVTREGRKKFGKKTLDIADAPYYSKKKKKSPEEQAEYDRKQKAAYLKKAVKNWKRPKPRKK